MLRKQQPSLYRFLFQENYCTMSCIILLVTVCDVRYGSLSNKTVHHIQHSAYRERTPLTALLSTLNGTPCTASHLKETVKNYSKVHACSKKVRQVQHSSLQSTVHHVLHPLCQARYALYCISSTSYIVICYTVPLYWDPVS